MIILYVDDEENLLEVGKIFLEKDGFEVETAQFVADAFHLMEDHTYDAIVSDYQMPVVDGIQFLVGVRSQYGDIPFILFTGKGREEIVIQAINNGVDFYLQKGGDPKAQFAELVHKIKQAILRRQAENKIRQQADAMEAAIDGMAILNNRQEYVYLNKAHAEIYGYSDASELIGKSWRVLYAPKELERFDQEIMPEFVQKGRYNGEAFGKKKDGTGFHQSISLTSLSNGEMICVVRDITEQKKLEKDLRERKDRYLRFFRISTDCVFITIPSGQLLDFNDAMMEEFGYQDWKELIKINASSLYFNPDDRGKFLEYIEQNGGYVREYPLKMRRRDGTAINTLITIGTEKNPDGSIKEYIGSIRVVKES